MRQTIRFKQFLAFVALFGVLSLAACESDSGEKDVTEPMGDTGSEDPGTTSPDATAQGPDTLAAGFDTTITVIVGEAETAVDLATLEAAEFEGKPAIRLTRIVEVAAIEMPWSHHYNFVSNDGFDVLRDKLEGDYAQLPYYAELDQGFVYFDEEQDIYRVGWDESLNFPKSLKVKGIGQGVIRAVEIPSTDIVVKVGDARARVDVTTLATQDVVYYKKPDDGPQPMATLLDLLAAAGVVAPQDFGYKFYGKDGYANNDDNLMLHDSAEHAWVQVANRRIIPSEGWDTELCCWSTRDTVLIVGVTPRED